MFTDSGDWVWYLWETIIYPTTVPDLREKVFSTYFIIKCDVSYGFFIDAFYQHEEVPFYFYFVFMMKEYWILLYVLCL